MFRNFGSKVAFLAIICNYKLRIFTPPHSHGAHIFSGDRTHTPLYDCFERQNFLMSSELIFCILFVLIRTSQCFGLRKCLMFPLFHNPDMIVQAYIPRARKNLRLGTTRDRRVVLSSLSSLTHQCHYQHTLQETYQNFVDALDFDPNLKIHPQLQSSVLYKCSIMCA